MTPQTRSYFRYAWFAWKPAIFVVIALLVAIPLTIPTIPQAGVVGGLCAFGATIIAILAMAIECKRRLLIIQWNEKLCRWLNHNSVAGINNNTQVHGGIHDESVASAFEFIRRYPWLINSVHFEWGKGVHAHLLYAVRGGAATVMDNEYHEHWHHFTAA